VRRSLERVEGDGPNSTRAELLVRRTMTLPRDNMKKFYDEEMGKKSYKDSIFWDHPPRKPGDVEDMNTAVFQALQGQAKSVGAEELCGCTVLAIVSRTGIYMAHYWENIAFAPDPDWVEEHGSVEKCFENTVISPLKDGAKGPIQKKKIAQVSLQSKAAEFNKDDINIKAYLLVPSKAFDDAPETYKAYRAKWKKIRKTVGEMIPALKEGTLKNPNPLWTEITYEPLEVESGALQFTAAGRILFKYDPDHEGKKKSLMWVEGDLNPKHEDQW
jgi:hypothetical protein